jgi:drug/metabolite transporter (DMT)-like permease
MASYDNISMQGAAVKKHTAAIILAYLTLYVVWGSTYLAIRIAVATMPPFYLVSLRFIIAGLGFLALAIGTGRLRRWPVKKEFLSAGFLGLFLLILGNGLVSVGEETVDSYIAAIIISSTPFCVAFFNRLFFKEKLHAARLAGMTLGLAGVAIILWKGQGVGFEFSSGILFIIAGFLAWSFATAMGSRLPVHKDSIVNSGIEMTMAGIIAFAGSIFAYGSPGKALAGVSGASWLAMAYLAVIGGAAFYAYTFLLANEPSYRLVSYAIVNPLIAVLLGMLILGEKAVPFLWLGVPVILAGLVLMLYGERIGTILGKALQSVRNSR